MDQDLPRFEEHYALGPELGRGSFGAVHRVTRRSDGAPAAAKLLHHTSPEARARVRREADLVRDLEHPNLVRLHGVFAGAEGNPVLVYDLVEGTTLGTRTGREPAQAPEVVGWVADLAEALRALHGAGLVHRDLKPENVMLDTAGRPRLLDYGLARPEAEGQTMTAEGLVLGTPVFMAPEVFDGERPSPADDVYALACLAYAALAGRTAHRGETPAEVLRSKRGPPPRLPKLATLTARQLAALDAAFARALGPERKGRFSDPRELAASLAEALEAKGSDTPGPTVALRATRPRVGAGKERPPPMSTGLFLRRTAVRVGPVVVVALLVFLGLQLRSGPAPGSAPAPAPPPPPPPRAASREAALAAAVARELAAVGEGPLAGDDPLRFGPLLAHLPSLQAHLQRRARGEVDWHALPEEDRAALRQVTADFRGQGLPDPFWPLLAVAPGEPMPPADDPVLRDLLDRRFAEDLGQTLAPNPGPWLRTAWNRGLTMRRIGEDLEDQLEDSQSPLVRELHLRHHVIVTSDPLGIFAGHFQDRQLRGALDRALGEGRRAFQAALWAVGCVVRHGSPDEAEEASHLLWQLASDYRFLFYSHLAQLEPEVLLGIPGTTPAGARAVYRVQDTQRRARSATPLAHRNEAPGRLDELADRMLGPPLTTVYHFSRAREGLGHFQRSLGRGAPGYEARREALEAGLPEPMAGWLRVDLGEVR